MSDQSKRCLWHSCKEEPWNDVEPTGELPICFTHAKQTWANMERELDDQEKMQALEDEAQILAWARGVKRRKVIDDKKRRASVKERRTKPGYVYYLSLDGHIKIGWTSNMTQRIRSYPPGTELLAYHPGTLETEDHFHNQFKVHLSKGREWYKPAEPIMEHIRKLQEVDKEPVAYQDHSVVDKAIPGKDVPEKNHSLMRNRGLKQALKNEQEKFLERQSKQPDL